MNRIKRISLFFRVALQVLFISLPILLVFGWITTPESLVLMGGAINLSFIPREYTNALLHTLSVSERIMGFSVSAIPLLIELFIIASLIRLFKLYERGIIFSLESVNYIRRVGLALLVGQLVNPFYEVAMGFVLTRHNPHGHRFAAITFDQTNIGIIFIALIVILISWIMAEGYRLREEQQLTI